MALHGFFRIFDKHHLSLPHVNESFINLGLGETNASWIQKLILDAFEVIRANARTVENGFRVGVVFDQFANVIVRSAIDLDSLLQYLPLQPIGQ